MVDLPPPEGPTSATVVPFGISKRTPSRTGVPATYSNETSSNPIFSPRPGNGTASGRSGEPGGSPSHSVVRSTLAMASCSQVN